ncbi:hypothetical protein [Yinghuangia sp. YIM S10712]|uniref:hypothetical protein n=1 Tax=Yinghuangia sp. YIM S10712 TaxID=3436930 RepID=UPI003F538AEC
MQNSAERRRAGAFYDSVLLAPTAAHRDPGVPGPRPVDAAATGPDGRTPMADPKDVSDDPGDAIAAPAWPPRRHGHS